MNNLQSHLHAFPVESQKLLLDISRQYRFEIKIKKSRQSKLGDFTFPKSDETPKISVNGDDNKYRVLITFLHELAHLIVWLEEGRSRNPHGSKWKRRYSQLLHIFLEKGVFPSPVKEALSIHIIKPKASTYADIRLLNALRQLDEDKIDSILLELPANQLFKLKNGKTYQKGELRRSRILCTELSSKRKYLIHSHAEVFPVNNL